VGFGVASSVVGFFCELRTNTEGGPRRLTRAGWVFGALVVLAGANSIATATVKVILDRRSSLAAEAAAAARRQEALEQAPLQRLRIEWTFTNVPEAQWARAAVGTRADPCREQLQVRRAQDKLDDFYPFLASLGGRGSDSVILLVALDDRADNVLPLGMVDAGVTRVAAHEEEPLAWSDTDPARLSAVAATIEFRGDLEQCVERGRVTAFAVERERRCDVVARLAREADRVTMQWDLNATCLARGIDGSFGSIPPMSHLPESMTMLLLTEIGDLPHDPADFSAWGETLSWTPQVAAREVWPDRSHVRLVANDSIAREYELRYHPFGMIAGKAGGAMIPNAHPRVTTFTSR
jgi:hypothetical protein